MIRGIVSGLLSGTAISVVILAGISLMLPPPGQRPDAKAQVAGTSDAAQQPADPVAPAETGAEPAAPAEPVQRAEAPASDGPEASPETVADGIAEAGPSAVAGPAAESAPAASAEQAQPAPKPADVAPETAVVEAPAGSEFTRPRAEEPAILPETDQATGDAAVPAVPAAAPERAPDLAGLSPEAAPAAGPAPVAPAAPAEPGDGASPAIAAADTRPESAPGGTTAPAGDAAPALATDAPAAPASKEIASESPPATTASSESAPEPAGGAGVEAPDATAPAGPAEAPASGSEAVPQPEASDVPPMIVTDAPEPPQGAIEAPKPGFTNAPGVKVNRLPSIGDSPAETADQAVEAPAAHPADLPPIARYAAKFDDPGAASLVAVILIDAGSEGLDLAGVASLGLPVTVAIDPNAPDAAARASALRSAGMEVAIQVKDLPRAATAADIEVAYQAMRGILGEAVGLFGAPGSGMIEDSRQADHFVALAKADGLAVFSLTGGLNALARDAASEGVPHAEVERQADANEADARTIRRALDRSVFEATQSGASVVALSTTAASLNALLAWAGELPETVVLAPASAVAVRAVAQ